MATLLALDVHSRLAVEKVMENSTTVLGNGKGIEEGVKRAEEASVRLRLRDRRLVLNEEKGAEQQLLVSS